MTAVTDSDILQHLQSRREYCRALLNLSRQQQELIGQGNYTELLDVVHRKQRVLGRLDALRQSQPVVMSAWQQRRGQWPEDWEQRCQAVVRETELLLADLLATEQQCTTQLTQRRDETRRQLSELSRGRNVHQAYEHPPETRKHPRYLDVNQ